MSETIIIAGRIRLDDTDFRRGLQAAEQAARTSASTQQQLFGNLASQATAHFRTVAQEARALASIQPFGDLGRQANAYFSDLRQQSSQTAREVAASWSQTVKEHVAAEQAATQQIVAEWRYLGQQAEETARKAELAHKEAARTVKEAWQGVGAIGGQLSLALTAPLAIVGQKAVEAAVDIESMKVGLATLMGSAKAGEEEFQRLYAISRKPGFDLPSVMQGVRAMVALGTSTNQAEERVRQLGNAVGLMGGTGEQLQTVVQQMVEMEGSGELMQRHLRSMMIQIPSLGPLIKEAFGTLSAKDIQKQLDANGKSASDFFDIITERLAKLPRAGETMKNQFRNATNDMTIALAQFGDKIAPAELALLNRLVPAIQKVGEWFTKLDEPTQTFALRTVAVFAAAGPVMFAVNQFRQGLESVGDLLKGLSLFMKGGAVAAEAAHQTAVDLDTIAVKANTTALEENAIAAQAASGAKAATAAGGLGVGIVRGLGAVVGAIGAAGASAAAVPVGIALAGTGLGWKAAEEQERRRGIDPSKTPGDWWKFIGPWSWGGENADAAKPIAAADLDRARRALPSAAAAHEESLKRAAVAPTSTGGRAFPDQPDPKALARMSDEAYQAKLAQVAVLVEQSPEEGRASKELQLLLPVIRERQAQIKKDGAEAAEGSKERLNAVREERILEEQALRLQHAAANEAKQAAQKAATEQKAATARFRAIRLETADAQVEAAKDEASEAAPGTQARKAADVVVFALEQKKAQVIAEAQALIPQFSATGEAQEQYSKLARQAWSIVREQNKLGLAAFKEEEADAKKAAKDREEGIKAAFGAQAEIAKAMVQALPQKEQAAAEVKYLVPALKQQQDFVVSELQSGKLSATEYLKEQKGYWDLQAEINHAKSHAADVEKEQVRKATEAAKKASEDARHLANAHTSLIEAEVKNFETAFGSHNRQAARYVLPSLVSEFQTTFRPVAGENETERLQRLTEGQSIEAKILDTAKRAGLNVRQVYAELQALSEIGESGKIDKGTARLAQRAGVSPRMLARDLISAQHAYDPRLSPGQYHAQAAEVRLELHALPPDWRRVFSDPAAERELEQAVGRILDAWRRNR